LEDCQREAESAAEVIKAKVRSDKAKMEEIVRLTEGMKQAK
jgi:hypothetical protein